LAINEIKVLIGIDMGDHYVPKYYLKGFSKDEGKTIWVYDKQESRKFSTQVKNVATETRFYTPRIEEYLANDIERQANKVLRKIRGRNKITVDDKKILSEYMVVMMKRVPQSQERIKNHMPSSVKKITQEYDDMFRMAASMQPEKAALLEKNRGKIQKYIEKYSKEQIKEIWLGNIPAEMSPHIVKAISSLTWIFLTFDKHPAFLTSDNPIFYFTKIGIGNPKSEIIFPISSHVALWANWRTDLSEGYYPADIKIIKEFCRRTVSIATRYIFHSDDEAWILPFITKGKWQLNFIQ
jgi:hypothetical protein